MPQIVLKKTQAPDTFTEFFEPSQPCAIKDPPKTAISSFNIKGDFIAYASPDSTYAVTRRLFDIAKKEIIIGIYDFSASYMKDLLMSVKNRGVKISLMLDVRKGEKEEIEIFEDFKQFGFTAVQAPSCSTFAKNHFFHSCHEKIVVIDGEWTLIQSGNYSNNSIPLNDADGGNPAGFITGNRDMGVAIFSPELAGFFSELIAKDIKLELGEPVTDMLESLDEVINPVLVEFAPSQLPIELFPSKTFSPGSPVKVIPVLTPDNYMDIIPEFLSSAKESIYIENQYIRGKQPQVNKLLEAIKKARASNPDLKVKIILGKIFSLKDLAKEKANIEILKQVYDLVLDENIRYIDTSRFVHCHNKLIIVDSQTVLISSQNWSDTGVSSNREAGLLMEYPGLAQYYEKIFESDWQTAIKEIPDPGPPSLMEDEVAAGNFVKVVAADYEEV